MGRPKQYDRIDLLNRSVKLFRRQGFNGTSTADLVDELAINRKSMYAEFGSKQQLFEATLDYYNENNLTRVLSPLEAPDASIEGIKRAFHGYASASEGPYQGLGCLMCNTAAERGALAPSTSQYIADYLTRLNGAFRHALGNSKESGEISPTIDIEEVANFLTTSLIGMAASIRAEAPPSQLWATYRTLASFVDSLT